MRCSATAVTHARGLAVAMALAGTAMTLLRADTPRIAALVLLELPVG